MFINNFERRSNPTKRRKNTNSPTIVLKDKAIILIVMTPYPLTIAGYNP